VGNGKGQQQSPLWVYKAIRNPSLRNYSLQGSYSENWGGMGEGGTKTPDK